MRRCGFSRSLRRKLPLMARGPGLPYGKSSVSEERLLSDTQSLDSSRLGASGAAVEGSDDAACGEDQETTEALRCCSAADGRSTNGS